MFWKKTLDPESPLEVEEVIECLHVRWGASYDMRLLIRDGFLYLQVMWAFLEQQSFPFDEIAYKLRISGVV